MTVPAEELEIIMVQCDLRIINVLRSKVYLVMHGVAVPDDAVLVAAFAQSADGFDIRSAAVLPQLSLIKIACKISCHISGHKKGSRYFRLPYSQLSLYYIISALLTMSSDKIR